ncbi:MAG TPA: hypothetical protein VET26_06000 [Candidatus Sulfotelmatobacter sp.]|nr:hypothetical protein [Candidatus Sulfotelmatobacter sp.]
MTNDLVCVDELNSQSSTKYEIAIEHFGSENAGERARHQGASEPPGLATEAGRDVNQALGRPVEVLHHHDILYNQGARSAIPR